MPAATLLAHLPDIPRWVETRAMLLSGRGQVLFLDSNRKMDAVIYQADTRIGTIIGQPPTAQVEKLTERVLDIIAAPTDASWIASRLPGWRRADCVLHQLSDPSRLSPPTHDTRLLEPGELGCLENLPGELRAELEIEIAAGASVAVSCNNGIPVSFCCAWSVTESQFDLGIDTLPGFRRSGHARACASLLIREMGQRGKQPVWGADPENEASLRLAASLGFRPVDTLSVFSAPRD